MARKKSQTLTDAELRLMKILWTKESCTVNDVLGDLPKDQPLAYSTVLTFLRILEKKGYIKHKKKGRAFLYYPVVTREQAQKSVLEYVVGTFFDKSPSGLVESLLKQVKIKPAEMQKIKDAIGKKK